MEKSAKPSPMAGRKRSISDDADMSSLYKEWDEVSCPICMDHPHNAVLLICNSYGKGCRSHICDTSYRHSNCFDRFKKLSEENTDNYTTSASTSFHDFVSASTRNFDLTDPSGLTINHVEMPGGSRGDSDFAEQEGILCERFDFGETHMEKHETQSNLRCPLCRGKVLGWKVLEEARVYLNLKSRTCSRESCSFSGNYKELRRHARRVHPRVCPAEVDPSRQQAWQRLEEQRLNSDIVTAIRSSMPGAIVLGDYVVDGGDMASDERIRERHVLGDYVFDNGSRVSGGNERWLSTFFLFHLMGSMDLESERRGGRSRGLARHRRPSGPYSRRRHLWGERLLQDDDANHEEEEDDDHNETDMDIFSDTGEDVRENPRRRRRLVRSTSD